MGDINLSLDAYASKNKGSSKRQTGGGGGGGGKRQAGSRRGGRRSGRGGGALFNNARGALERRGAAPYSKGRADGAWKHDKFDEVDDDADLGVGTIIAQPQVSYAVQPQMSVSTGGDLRNTIKAQETKLFVSNVEKQITEDELLQLFNGIGKVKFLALNYDAEGNSRGTAVVCYLNRADANKSISEFNGRQLDGEELNIEFITSSDAAATATAPSTFLAGNADPMQQIKTVNYVDTSSSSRQDEDESTFYGLAANSHSRRSIGRRRVGDRDNRERRNYRERRNNRVSGGGARGGRRERKSQPSAEDIDAKMTAYMKGKKTGGDA